MIPLAITAHLRGPITGAPMLDGLLAFVVAARAGHVAGFGPLEQVEIPIAMEPEGRFHMCSSPIVSWDQRELRYINRKFPLHEAQLLGDARLRRVQLSAGATKSYRIPGEVAWAERDVIRWYAIADADAVREILLVVTHLGKRRAVGRGAIDRWEVEPCESWGEGFPVVHDGKPVRPLPADYPGLHEPSLAYSTLSFPYYQHERETLCAVP